MVNKLNCVYMKRLKNKYTFSKFNNIFNSNKYYVLCCYSLNRNENFLNHVKKELTASLNNQGFYLLNTTKNVKSLIFINIFSKHYVKSIYKQVNQLLIIPKSEVFYHLKIIAVLSKKFDYFIIPLFCYMKHVGILPYNFSILANDYSIKYYIFYVRCIFISVFIRRFIFIKKKLLSVLFLKDSYKKYL